MLEVVLRSVCSPSIKFLRIHSELRSSERMATGEELTIQDRGADRKTFSFECNLLVWSSLGLWFNGSGEDIDRKATL